MTFLRSSEHHLQQKQELVGGVKATSSPSAMAPRNKLEEPVYAEDMLGVDQVGIIQPAPIPEQRKRPPMVIVWRNVFLFVLLHIGFIYSLTFFPVAKYQTILWSLFTFWLSATGITAGAHRLWAHRSYKAKLPLRIFLTICNCLSFQNSIYEWARDHRAHHKYSETDADPHNAKRGFFFAHMGWLMVRKHPDVKEKGKSIDLSDLTRDPVLMFQHRYYKTMVLIFWFALPTYLPVYWWGESALTSFYVAVIFRYTAKLHATWLVNSAAHMWGSRPYDKTINPSENLCVTLLATGEGFHNYHHVFPHDYATSEFGWHFNITTLFIDTMHLLGQVTDRRKISHEVIRKRKERTGDGTGL